MKPSTGQPLTRDNSGFTLTELLVVLGVIGLFSAMLLPALAGSKSQTRIAACAARFRQWAVSANLYANDHRGWLPSSNPAGGGEYADDVGTNLVDQLVPYNLTVPSWFDPFRPTELNNYVTWVHQNYPGQSPAKAGYLRLYLSRFYPQQCHINDNYWVPRTQGSTSFPTDFSSRPQFLQPPWLWEARPSSLIYGWPQRLHDVAAAHVPFVSDVAASGNSAGLASPKPPSPDQNNISPTTAHFVNGQLIGVNLVFMDGHVAGHTPSQMKPVYASPGGAPYWFY